MSNESRLKAYLDEKLLGDLPEGVSIDEPLLDSGIIDSSGIFELVEFMESAFDIEIADDEVVPEHFETITAMATFIERKSQR